jgi:hypothetical protein
VPRAWTSAAVAFLDDDTTSPASRRLASAHAALAPKCNLYSLPGADFSNRILFVIVFIKVAIDFSGVSEQKMAV